MNGRTKGNVAEREVAEKLQEWWRPFEPGCRFVRTPSSGGWHGKTGGDVRAGFRASGDLMTTAKEFPYTVEVKRREGFTWGRVLDGKPSPVWGWWKQAQTQATEQGSQPMLWLRHNREPWMVMLEVNAQMMNRLVVSCRWTLAKLRGVDYGDCVPFLTEAQSLVDVHPSIIVCCYN